MHPSTITKCCFAKNNEHDDAHGEHGRPFVANRGDKKKECLIYNELPRCDLAVAPRWTRGESGLPYDRLAAANRSKLETYSPAIVVHKAATRFPMKFSLPSSRRPGRPVAIYRPYLWHSGTLTVPAIPLYAAVNSRKVRRESTFNTLNLAHVRNPRA